MKNKIVTSLIAAILISGAAYAEDTTVLTKAVVKIIKDQHELKQDIGQLNLNQELGIKRSSELKDTLDLTRVDLDKSNQEISALKADSVAHTAKLNTQETDIMNIKNSIDLLSKKDIELEAILKGTSMEASQAKAGNMDALRTTSELNSLQSTVAALKEQIEALKVVTTAEIDMIKARFSRNKPIYVIEDNPGCKTGKCPKAEDNRNNDEIIDSFLKNN